MKKISKILICLLIFIISATSLALAEEPIKVSVNGEIINFDNPPVIRNERTLVPVRKIFEALDVIVRWDDTTKTVFAFKENTVISIPLNSKTATIQTDENTVNSVELDAPAQIIESRTYVPVRFIGESLGAKVDWNGETKTVVITMEVKKNIQRFEYDNGYYEGEVKDGNFNGYGKYVWKTGKMYEGNWVNGEIQGQGKFTWENGDSYEGNWLDGKMHGQGKYTWSNGDVFVGEYVKDKMSEGVVTKADGQTINIDKTGNPANNNEEDNSGYTEFQQQALGGPSYEELMKNSTKFIDKPCYFSGEVIQAIEEENGKSLFLIDISSSSNDFVDMYNTYSDDPNILENVETRIVAVFSDNSVDILQDDIIRAYGKVMEKFTYQDTYGNTHTVPAMKLSEFERTSLRSDEVIDMMFD
ncbi:copper amine oxidase N-terminal domain-containing protein [Paramaledivibacter caminithermalis]|jgi:hypothetical protein|uniref:Uncharacterized conserved protein n=1 Tax=Paramaledivibacter caminithermalis (strain DSM 15212 / CIP 107654 / DViRD3) TaxID=1121301 RepID=A0A1M6NBB4_PARC5|nr:copper amine oxidase N-terminal domain-containing protein [Paramaledivibacter caminithermalis]SHJ92836.1 Uncharacterized conserved protein [Paramaledivibacter caminithermalis DSM 15212]